MKYQSDLPISSLTGKERFESIKEKTFAQLDGLLSQLRCWLFVGILLAVIFFTNLLLIMVTKKNGILVLQLNATILGDPDIITEDKMPQIVLILPTLVLIILAVVPYAAGRMLSQSLTVTFSKQIVKTIKCDVMGIIFVSVVQFILDCIYFINLDSDDQTIFTYVITGSLRTLFVLAICLLGYKSYLEA